MKNSFWRTITIGIVLLLFPLLNSCDKEYHGIKIHGVEVPHLYGFNNSQITDYLRMRGYSDVHPDTISRNSTGSVLYISNYYRDNSIVLVVSPGGKIQRLVPPAKFAYLNDKEEFVAWFDDIKKGVNFKNGAFRPIVPLFGYFGIDPSGQFFFIGHSSGMTVRNGKTIHTAPLKYRTEIASTDVPEKLLYYSNLAVENIFSKNDRVFIFARNYQNIKDPDHNEQHEIVCHVLKRNNVGLEFVEEIHIPRPNPSPSPFAVVDIDPWSDNILLVDVKDIPFSFLTSWYLFDLQTKKMTKLGRARDYGFFLKERIF